MDFKFSSLFFAAVVLCKCKSITIEIVEYFFEHSFTLISLFLCPAFGCLEMCKEFQGRGSDRIWLNIEFNVNSPTANPLEIINRYPLWPPLTYFYHGSNEISSPGSPFILSSYAFGLYKILPYISFLLPIHSHYLVFEKDRVT